jgi:hypothetical protein
MRKASAQWRSKTLHELEPAKDLGRFSQAVEADARSESTGSLFAFSLLAQSIPTIPPRCAKRNSVPGTTRESLNGSGRPMMCPPSGYVPISPCSRQCIARAFPRPSSKPRPAAARSSRSISGEAGMSSTRAKPHIPCHKGDVVSAIETYRRSPSWAGEWDAARFSDYSVKS